MSTAQECREGCHGDPICIRPRLVGQGAKQPYGPGGIDRWKKSGLLFHLHANPVPPPSTRYLRRKKKGSTTLRQNAGLLLGKAGLGFTHGLILAIRQSKNVTLDGEKHPDTHCRLILVYEMAENKINFDHPPESTGKHSVPSDHQNVTKSPQNFNFGRTRLGKISRFLIGPWELLRFLKILE